MRRNMFLVQPGKPGLIAIVCTLLLAAGTVMGGVSQKDRGSLAANQEISFIDTSNGGLYVMRADGSNPHQVLAAGQPESLFWPTWSPDGRSIALMRDSGSTGGKEIWTVGLNGNDAHFVVATATIGRIDWCGEPAPDGQRKICFTDWAPGTQVRDIYIVSPDGTGLTNLTNSPGHNEGNAFWYGSRVAYVRKNQLVAINLRLDTGGNVYAESENVLVEQLEPGSFALSTFRAANKLPRVVFSGRSGLKSINFGTELPQHSTLTTPSAGTVDRWPCFSPTGEKVVFDRLLASGGHSVYTMNADGTGLMKIRDNAHQPNWRQF